ncbi:tRNA pseudouridine synthase D [Aquisphaera giovannonii]|uniref:tRNA pseudouridine synthase D n=1 Tax=Aquisphaera giovannonii TaxID=406548 RepID=A0A5B9WAN5_9BACT|nr:tRNA pseudouridine(13) synthase TruD [Aquisphaera giovannonii]QEH37636.1 tRNA pseudouridine synthase D [Aquisphaera giovannonii]
MKVKREPEDFRVDERIAVRPAERGRYVLYRLSKRGLGTIEAVDLICRRWNLAGRRVSYGGLKDRHAVTTQYLSILEGPDRPIREPSFELEPVGRLDVPYGPQHFDGNRFGIVLRDMAEADAASAIDALERLPADGLPNYFDDQRFGSVGFSGEFIGHAWLKGDHERALRLALAEPTPFDRSGVKAQKAVVRRHWRDWAEAKARLDRSSTRSIVTYLVDHPEDFRGAFARLKRELRTLYFSAFQSHLWNLLLSAWIDRMTRPDQRVPVDLKVATLTFPRGLDEGQREAFRAAAIPLPSARTPEPAGSMGELAREVLTPFQLEWKDLRVRHLKDVFLSKGSRAAIVYPEDVRAATEDDGLHPGRKALRMGFSLGKGSYATILVKRITGAAGAASPTDGEP